MNRAGSSAAGALGSKGAAAPATSRSGFDRGAFTKDIASMMYAFGDVPAPSPAAVGLMEEMAVDFMVDLCMRARPSPLAVPQASPSYPPTARLKAKVEDFKHALRREPKYLARLQELLYMEFVIQEARKTFDETEYGRDEVPPLAPPPPPHVAGEAAPAPPPEGLSAAAAAAADEPEPASASASVPAPASASAPAPAPVPAPAAVPEETKPEGQRGKRGRPSSSGADAEPKKRKKKDDSAPRKSKGKVRADAGSPPPAGSSPPPASGSNATPALALPGLALPGTPASTAHPSPAQATSSLPGSGS